MWAEEYHTRDIGLYMAIQMCRPQDGDWVFLSDIDELPRPDMLNALVRASTPNDVDRKWIPWTYRLSETSDYYGGDITMDRTNLGLEGNRQSVQSRPLPRTGLALPPHGQEGSAYG